MLPLARIRADAAIVRPPSCQNVVISQFDRSHRGLVRSRFRHPYSPALTGKV
ncbi:hypothetical protein [Chamaesiphon polymorphus]|uniref:hypothetical protein n=1 Tax=Chamaesiphon polymorphus TaxID=2107691 RepID=UPI0015E6A944|nr:hypothetical protein [Chamaesiphon polymorphus]